MAILVNAETGLAEDVKDPDIAVKSGAYRIPLVDPSGNISHVPYEESQRAIGEGYKEPDQNQLQSMMEYAHYKSTPEQIKAGLEAVGRGAIPFGGSTAAQIALGADKEAIRKREEYNPEIAMAGEMAGLVGSEFVPGLGQANLLTKAGKAVSKGLQLEQKANLASKVGSMFAKGATENAMYALGSNVSKAMVADDPNEVYQNALTDIGLNAVIGGTLMAPFGAVSPMWKMAKESGLGQLLSKVKDHASGKELGLVPESIEHAIEQSGIELSPEVRAAVSSEPTLRRSFQELQESATGAGKKAQEKLEQFKTQVNDSILTKLVKVPEDIKIEQAANPDKDIIGDYARTHIESLRGMSEHKLGQKVTDTLSKELDDAYKPIKEMFDEKKLSFKDAILDADSKAKIADDLNKYMNEAGLNLVSGSPQEKLINKAIESLANVKTLEDLTKVRSAILDLATEQPMWKTGSSIRRAFNDAEERIFEAKIAEKSPELLENFKNTRKQYGELKEMMETLNDRVHVGKYYGAETFIKSLKEMNPEVLLNRLSKESDAGLLELLSSRFPKTSEMIKDYHLNDLLKTASIGAKGEHIINPTKIFKAMDKWSPELKKYVLPEGAEQGVLAAKQLIEALPNKMNTSGTAKTLDMLGKGLSGGIGGAIGVATGGIGGAGAGYLLGQLTHYLGREAPDAIKLGLLKFLGSDAAVNAPAFKATVDYLQAAINGYKKTDNAIKSIFKAGREVIPTHMIPSDKQREKLDKRLKELHVNNEELMNVGGDKGYYLPEHQTAAAMTAMNAVNYLNSIRPQAPQAGPLDEEYEISDMQKEEYNNQLDIAQQPLIALKNLKDGTITSKDVTTFKVCYPGLYASVSKRIMEQLVDVKANKEFIPYETRLGLSLFLGQPLDATMTPQSIMANQKPQVPQENAEQQMMPQRQKGSLKALDKYSNLFKTGSQARMESKSEV